MININFLTKDKSTIEVVNRFLFDWNNSNLETIQTATSGSTGTPKIIELKKQFMRASALASGRFFSFDTGQKIRLALSASTIGGKMLLLRGLLFDMEIEVVQPSKNPIIDIDHAIDFISLVPYQLENILRETPKKLQWVKTVLLGGAPVSESLLQQIKANVSSQVFLSYGMTETMSHVALRNLKTEDNFHAIDNVHFSISENHQLIIDAPALGIEKLLTNDVVEWISPTEFKWKGRSDYTINSAGVKIHPEMVEQRLSSSIQTRFFISGEADEHFGQRVVLIIEGVERKVSIPFDQLLSKYEIPKRIYFVRHFAETQSGKIDRLTTQNQIDAK